MAMVEEAGSPPIATSEPWSIVMVGHLVNGSGQWLPLSWLGTITGVSACVAWDHYWCHCLCGLGPLLVTGGKIYIRRGYPA